MARTPKTPDAAAEPPCCAVLPQAGGSYEIVEGELLLRDDAQTVSEETQLSGDQPENPPAPTTETTLSTEA